MAWSFRAAAPRGPLLSGERLLLRPPQPGDYAQWVALRQESRDFLEPWEPSWPADALARHAFRRRLQHYALEQRQGLGVPLFLLRREDERLVGGVSITNIRRGVAQAASLGYWVGAPFAHQGYMTEALRLVLDYSFDALGLHRLEAATLPNNAASRGLLLKLGFREEGYAREYLRIAGRWQDHVLFALLEEEHRRSRIKRLRVAGEA